ncbi:MAG: DinB family protein [Lutibacter sp.]
MKQIIAQFELQTSLFLNSLENISDQESNLQNHENLNPIKWVAGHIANTRMSLITILTGKSANPTYQKHFGKGSSNKFDKEVPTIENIMANWLVVTTELTDILKNLSEEKQQTLPPFQTSIPDQTLHGLIAYFAIHEAHHIGQISVLRKLIDKDTMKMNRI